MVSVYLFGKKYEVPESLTIMEAMEYAGYQLVRGCGCRNGFCGANFFCNGENLLNIVGETCNVKINTLFGFG